MSTLAEAKERYKKETGRAAHHTWDLEKILEKLNGKNDNKGDEKPPPEENKKKELKPVKETLFIPKFGDVEARIVARKDWTEKDTKDYRESYKDRLKKSMKILE